VSEGQLRILEALGEEFHRLGAPATRRRSAVRRSAVLALVVVLLLAGAAAAAILITRGAPLSAPSAADLSSSGVPLAGSAQLAGLDAADPDPTAPPWDVRLSRTAAGETCTAVGQVLDGQFGIVGLDRVFRALPLGGVDACGVASADGPVLAGARDFVGSGSEEARTVVNGVAGPGARSVTAYGPDGTRVLRLGPDGSFVTVYAGYVEDVRPRVVVVGADGRSHTVTFASSSVYEVADPGGGSPWMVSGDRALQPGAFPDEDCAQATQVLGRTDPSVFDAPLTPEVCGRLGSEPLFAVIRRFVPGSGGHGDFPWGNNPARTLVYGAAAPRVRGLVLSGVGTPRRLAINPRGGTFLAVLDGHVDPRSLTLSASLADGRTETLHQSTKLIGEGGEALKAPAVAAYRDPLPVSQTLPPPFAVPIAGTVSETLHAADPAGGPEWAVRSWQATPSSRTSPSGSAPGRFFCSEVGVVENGTLVRPGPDAGSTPTALTLSAESASGGCDDTKSLERIGPAARVTSYLADPSAYSPQVLRTVVSGVLAPGAGRALLVGAGGPRALRLDANHAFLAVLPGRYWDAQLEISAVIDGRRVTHKTVFDMGQQAQIAPQARAPDPDGGAPWGFAAGTNGSSAFGRIVDGRLAGIDQLTGTLSDGPEGTSSGGQGGGADGREPREVAFNTQGGPVPSPLGAPAPSPTAAEMARRTLPGTTIITGIARADVTTVTLVTPRDVRTLRPAGPEHVLIVVYDGQFFSGALTASIHLRDGRTVTESIANPAALGDGSSATPPSLVRMLEGAERQLAQLERSLSSRRLSAQGRATAIGQLTSIVRVIHARIAYEAEHPGRLPRA
jgi:hypothetical protein